MRKILCSFLFLFGMSLTAQAQITPQEKPTENAPSKDTSKSEKSESSKEVEGSIDLDSFFKKGEENARNGASCDKPSEPADPVA